MPTIPSKHNPLFRDAARAFLDKGWPANALLPGVPIGATMSPGSSVKTGSIGKVPGRWIGGAWVGLSGAWATKGLAGAELNPAAIETWPTDQVCVAGYEVCGIDIDGGADVVELVLPIFEAWAGEDAASVRKRDDGSARCIAPFRPAGGPGAIPSSSVTFVRGTERVMVEIKGRGHHWTGSGGHPSGCRYVWTHGVPSYAALPALDVETVSLMRQAIIKAMEGAGWAVSIQSVSGGGAEQSVLDGPCVLSPETVSAVMAGAENNLSWDDAISVLSALRGALGREGTTPPDGVYVWARKHPGSDDDWLDKRWSSLTAVRSGVGGLVKWLEDPARGNRPDLVALIDGEADRIRARNVFEDEPEAAAAPGKLLDALRSRRDALVEQIAKAWVYCAPDDSWLRTASRGEARFDYKLGFNNIPECKALSAIDHEIMKLQRRPDANDPAPRTAAKILHSFEHYKRVTQVAGQTSSFGDGELIEGDDGQLRLNNVVMRPFELVKDVTDKDVRRFLSHVEALLPGKEEREVLLNWFAWMLQNPKEKIRWAIILKGMQGSGKNTLVDFLVDAVGRENYADVSAADLKDGGKFNEYVSKRLVVVGEAPQADKNSIYDAMKTPIGGGSGGTIQVNPKYGRMYKAIDRGCYLLLTNHDNAIAFQEGDRRFYVAETRDMPETGSAECEALHDEMIALNKWREAGGWRVVASWLLKRDVSKFNASHPPAATQAKRDMETAAAPLFSRWFQDALDSDGPWSKRTVLSPGAVVSWVRRNRGADPELRDVSVFINDKQVADALRRAGWHSLGRVGMLRSGMRKQITAYVRDKAMLAGVDGPSALVALFLKEEREMPGVIGMAGGNGGGGNGYLWGVEDDPKGKDRPN